MRSTIRYVGFDVHKETVTIAVADANRDPEVLATVPNRWVVLQRHVKRLARVSHRISKRDVVDSCAGKESD